MGRFSLQTIFTAGCTMIGLIGLFADCGLGATCAANDPPCLRAQCLGAAVAERQASCTQKGAFPVTIRDLQSCEASVQFCSAEGIEKLSASLDCVDRLLLEGGDPCSVEYQSRLYRCSYPNTGPNRCEVR